MKRRSLWLHLEHLEDRTLLSSPGDIEWVRQFGSLLAGNTIPHAVGSDGNLYVAGEVSLALPGQTFAGGATDAYVRKYDDSGAELWTHEFGTTGDDSIWALVADASGIYVAGYLAGQGTHPATLADAFLRKYDPAGNELWTRQFGTAGTDQVSSVAVNGSSVYVAGYTDGTLPGQTNSGGNDVFVRKYDDDGNELWTRQFGTTGTDIAHGISVSASAVYVVGNTNGILAGQTGGISNDVFVRAYDTSGAVLWTRQFGTTADDAALGVATDASGVYVVGGVGGSIVQGQTSAGAEDAFVRKYDTAGNILWTNQFGSFYADFCTGVAVDASGVYVSGDISIPLPARTISGSDDAFLRKYDTTGNVIWTRQFGTPNADQATGVAVSASGVYVIGWTQNAGFLPFARKYDASGNQVWAQQLSPTLPGAQDLARAIGFDGALYVAGDVAGALPGQFSADVPSAGYTDAFVRKYDAAGNELWTRQFGSIFADSILGIAVDASGLYVTGYTNGELSGQSVSGEQDAFVCKFDKDGNVLWTRQFGTAGTDQGASIAVDASGVYVGGFTDGTFAGQSNAGGQDAFVRKFDLAGNVLWTRQFGTASTDQALGLAMDPSGLYVKGFTKGTLPGQISTNGSQAAFIRKYDTSGNELWTREFGSTEQTQANSVAADNSGVYLAGWTSGPLPGQSRNGSKDAFVRKYDPDGTELWTSEFGLPYLTEANSIAVSDSGIYVAGSTTGFPGQTSSGSAFLRRVNAGGDEVWTRQFGNTFSDSAAGVVVNASGLFVVGSTFWAFPGQTNLGRSDVYVAKIVDGGGDNLAPVAHDEAYSVDAGNTLTIAAPGLLANDSDPNGDALKAFQVVGGPYYPGIQHGILTLNTDGSFSYTPFDGFGTTDSFTYLASDGLATSNIATVSIAIPYAVDEDTTLTVAAPGVLGNYPVDPDDSPTAVLVSGTSHGTLSLNDDGSFAYTPNAGFNGIDNFTFYGTNGFSNFDPITIMIRINPVNHAPIASDDAYTVDENNALIVAAPGLLANDTDVDGDQLTAILVSGPSHGTLTLNTDGSFSYIPVPNFNGADNFTYQDNDGAASSAPALVNLTITAVSPQPTSTSLSSSDSASVFGQSVTFTARVAATGGDLSIPSGTVQFRVDGSEFGSPVALVNGTASISTAVLSVGPHTITAFYSGDNLFAASTADLLNQLVNQATTATAEAVSAPTPLFGADSLTVSAVVSVVTPGSSNPTGTVTFYDGPSVLGTADLVAGVASMALGNTALAAGSHTIRAVYSGDDNFKGSESTAAVNVLAPSTIQGLVYVDANNNGQVDFGEMGTSGVAVTLTGIDDLGHSVGRTVQTDSNGVYAFINLRPSNATGYMITETQPAGFLDGQDTLGTINGVPVGSNAINDVFSGIVLSQVGLLAENYNFGELPSSSGGVGAGQTAGIGFWQNRNGQNLIRALNGGSSATQLGHWLAMTFPNMYAALDGKTNAQVADFYKMLFARTAQTAPGGPPKVDAQVLATAFAVYVTNQSLAGTTAVAYGFQVDATGVGSRTFNVGAGGAAFGVSNNSNVSVLDLLLAVNARSHNGLLFDLNGDGHIDSPEVSFRTMANNVFDAINEAGGN